MKEPPVYNYGKLIHTPENEAAYANYLRRYVAAYAEQGIHIDQLHLQNEPTSTQKFPSCVWTGEEMRDFIKRNFADGICPDTDLWLGTLNGPASDERYCWTRFNNYAHTVLQDEVCRKVVAGVGYQWGGKFAVQQTHDSYPELELIQTESECGNGENTWEYALYIYELMHHYFRNGASAYMYWNMVLPAGGESSWGWRQNSLVTVNEAQPQYNHEYYLMKHFAHFRQARRTVSANARRMVSQYHRIPKLGRHQGFCDSESAAAGNPCCSWRRIVYIAEKFAQHDRYKSEIMTPYKKKYRRERPL